MKSTSRLVALLLLSLFTLHPSLFLSAAPPAERGTVIERGSGADEWQWLFSALAAKGATFSTFTENRYFTARKEPITLQGEMRLAPERGLSLRYTAPGETLTIIDSEGLLLRDAKGRTRQIKAGTRDAGLVTALLPVMRFDSGQLFKQFTVYAARDGGDWRFDFVPLNEKLASALGAIVVTGIGTEIKKITFNTSPKLRVEVLVGESKAGVAFTADELQRYFRADK
ncbi:hypothetical protein M2103_001868 [Ereboglobus sp. PH5-5]|uniref:LolA-related protein n=1 Tax=Ereboglobus sp. PH5-5 TaxID=2940529 RepID=UPI002406BE31|nr:LolA-related protein [Ereboglobus sp. PH5-5]MDF9833636.1 hypothetical protein [Ereboglobus sp. PH5-5]